MKFHEAKNKIIKHRLKLEEKEQAKQIAYEKQKQELIEQIQRLKPRIKKMLELGNLCLENDIDIGKLGNDALYTNNIFETDGIDHQLGFYTNHFEGYPIYKCSHYDYIGYDMGGFCGDINFITNGDVIASTPNYEGFAIKEISDPLVKHMIKFINDFPVFEREFERFINEL